MCVWIWLAPPPKSPVARWLHLTYPGSQEEEQKVFQILQIESQTEEQRQSILKKCFCHRRTTTDRKLIIFILQRGRNRKWWQIMSQQKQILPSANHHPGWEERHLIDMQTFWTSGSSERSESWPWMQLLTTGTDYCQNETKLCTKKIYYQFNI